MLKTNSKKAIENIRTYILDNYTPEAYNLPETSDFRTAAKEIYRCFYAEAEKFCAECDFDFELIQEVENA